MSMHEIEDLIERSVCTIAASSLDPKLVRDLIVNLFRYQNDFDCGDTQGRVRDILRDTRAILHFPLREHPDATRFAALFELIEKQEWCSLHAAKRDDGAPGLYAFFGDENAIAWDATSATACEEREGFSLVEEFAGAHAEPPLVLIEAGSLPWQNLRERLSGLDAEAPSRFTPQKTVSYVVAEAERTEKIELIAWWYAVLPWFVQFAGDPASFRDDPDAHAILAVVERTHAFEKRSDRGLLKIPEEAILTRLTPIMQELTRWWYKRERSLPPPPERTKIVVEAARNLRASLQKGEPPGPALTRAVSALGEFAEGSSFLTLFNAGFGYPISDPAFTTRIKRVIDVSSGKPMVNEAIANAELELQ